MSTIIVMRLVNRFGVHTTAAFSGVMQLWNYAVLPASAISAAASMMAAQNIGAHRWDRVSSIAQTGIVYSAVITSSVVILIYALDFHAYGLFFPENSPAKLLAGHINRVIAWSLVPFAIALMLFGVARAAGAVVVPLLIDAISFLVVRFLLVAALLDRWQADALWWSCALSPTLAVLLAAIYYKYGGWRTIGLRMVITMAKPDERASGKLK